MKYEELDRIDAKFEREFKQWCIGLPIYLITAFGALFWMLSKVPT